MRGWSFPLGRWFGVDLRVHAFFMLLLVFCLLAASVFGVSGMRGFTLWMLLAFAVAVREAARTTVTAYYRIQLRSILLLPIGGLFSFTDPESAERANEPRPQLALALAGPLANFAVAATLAALIAGASPDISLLGHPWVTPAHLMRSAIWLNVALGLLHMLPAYPLDGARLLQNPLKGRTGKSYAGIAPQINGVGSDSEESTSSTTPARKVRAGSVSAASQPSRAASRFGRFLGIGAMVAGIALLAIPGSTSLAAALSPWLIVGGFFIAVGAQLETQGVLFQSVVDTVTMRDVMLTDFSTLSPSDTLEDALYKTIHSLQDDFPVVRGTHIVGVTSKQNILDALHAEGNGYVQSIMSRSFQIAQPDDSLGLIIRRMRRGRMALVPVSVDGQVIGVVTLQNLMHSMGLLAEHRKVSSSS